ncbi:tetratricopeptide repeat protein [Desulfobulbus sp.]|uniref:tetratricopeptide repeat protein n=1 Tax=Desulfobulbus sp. TaxID=895 RepID=UPI00286F3FBC|nr:tetratricopeptide repeat protein [Desulfobulbus sp.]
MGNLNEARSLLIKAVAINEKAYKPDHPTLAISYSNLATVEQDLGNLNEARALMLKAIAINEKIYEPDHPTLATSYSNLAMVEQNLDNIEESLAFRAKYIAIQRHHIEQNDRNDLRLELAYAEHNQGQLQQQLGQLAEAEASQRAYLEQIRCLVDKEGRTDLRTQVEIALTWLASVLYGQGKVVEVEVCHKERVALLRQLLAEHREEARESDLAEALGWQGKSLHELGLFPQALLCYRESLQIDKVLTETNHARPSLDYMNTLYAVADVEEILGLYPAARQHLLALLALLRDLPSLEQKEDEISGLLDMATSRLCDVLIASKELADASNRVREYGELPKEPPEQVGHVNLHLLKLCQLQGQLALEQQRFEEAIAWFRQGLEQARHAEAAGQPEAGFWADSFQYRLAQALFEAHLPESEAAVEIALSCCRKWVATSNQDNANSFLARSLMLKARALLESGQSTAACPYAEEAQTLLQPLAGKAWFQRKFLAECLRLHADIRESSGEGEVAGQLRHEATTTLERPQQWEL